MSTFVVFGVCMEDCKEAAFKKTKTWSKELKRQLTVEEHATKANEMAAEMFREFARPKQISAAFDTPHFAQDFIAIAKKTLQAHSLKIMVKAQKYDEKGRPMSRKNGLPLLAWTAYKP